MGDLVPAVQSERNEALPPGPSGARPGRLGPLPVDLPFHPVFFALYPVASLLAENLEYTTIDAAGRAALVLVLFAGALTLAAKGFTGHWQKAALLSTPLLGILLSYGLLYSTLKVLLGASIARHRYLAPLLLVLLIAWSLVVIRRIRSTSPLSTAFNLAGITALLFPLTAILRASNAHLLSDSVVDDQMTSSSNPPLLFGRAGTSSTSFWTATAGRMSYWTSTITTTQPSWPPSSSGGLGLPIRAAPTTTRPLPRSRPRSTWAT
jgi:hypothetical protein